MRPTSRIRGEWALRTMLTIYVEIAEGNCVALIISLRICSRNALMRNTVQDDARLTLGPGKRKTAHHLVQTESGIEYDAGAVAGEEGG